MSFTTFFASWRKRPSRQTTRKPTARLAIETLEGRDAPSGLGASPDLLDKGAGDGSPSPLALVRAAASDRVVQPFVYRSEGQVGVLPDGTLGATLTAQGTIIGTATGSASLNIAANGQDISGAGSYTDENGDQLYFSFVGQFNKPAGTVEHNQLSGTATFQGGTGRFADAIGTVTFHGVIDATGSFYIAHTGQLSY